MTSREIVHRTLEFNSPDRVARSYRESDFCKVSCKAKTHETEWAETGGGRWERTDEWGNTWGRVDPTSKGEVTRGVLTDLKALDDYEFPDYSNAASYRVIEAKRAEFPEKWLVGGMPGFAFNIARKMRKLDTYLMDLLLERERIRELHDRIDALLEDMIRNYAASGVDSVMFPEDWGTQDRTLIHPDLWRDEFFPRFANLCGIAHKLGIKVFMHSCGRIAAIVPGLIEAGIDVLQFDQPDLHGIGAMSRYQEENRITFWCPVDIQNTLQTQNESIIRARAKEMLDELWCGRGGFIAGFYKDNASIGLDPKWQDIASDAFTRNGVRARYQQAQPS
jgi:hypothetical protein